MYRAAGRISCTCCGGYRGNIFRQGIPLCDRCLIKLLSRGYTAGNLEISIQDP